MESRMAPGRHESESMAQKRNKILSASLFLALLIVAFAAARALLGLLHAPYADWLRVETPRFAVAGSPLDVRITLGNVPEPSLLVVNLYLLGKNHKAIGSLPTANPSPSVRSGGTYSFTVDVKEVEKLALVQLVVYLSPTGSWQGRTHGASTEAVPVKIPKRGAGSPGFKKLRAFAIHNTPNPEAAFQPGGRAPEPEVFHRPSALFRLALLGLLCSGGLVCLIRAVRRRSGVGPGPAREWIFWLGAAALLFTAIFWELFRLEERLSAWGRQIVLDMDIYYFHQSYQKAFIALIAAGIAGALILSVRVMMRNRAQLYPALVGMALAVYLGLSLAGALSFHYIDVLNRISLAGASLIDAAKAACAAAILIFGLSAFRTGKR